jgi:hypothetical protein
MPDEEEPRYPDAKAVPLNQQSWPGQRAHRVRRPKGQGGRRGCWLLSLMLVAVPTGTAMGLRKLLQDI